MVIFLNSCSICSFFFSGESSYQLSETSAYQNHTRRDDEPQPLQDRNKCRSSAFSKQKVFYFLLFTQQLICI